MLFFTTNYSFTRLSKTGGDGPANIIGKRQRVIPVQGTTLARDIAVAVVVAPVARRVAPGSDGVVARGVEGGLRAESCVLGEALAVVVLVELELVARVADEATGGIDGLEREAVAVGKTGADGPAGCLLVGIAAVGRDNGGVHGVAVVGDVLCVAAGGGGAQRDGGVGRDGQVGASGERGGSIFGSNDVGLHSILGLVRWVAGGHDTFVESTLGLVAVVTANTEDNGTLLDHGGIVTSWANTAVVGGQVTSGGITTTEGPLVRASLENAGDEAERNRHVVRAVGRVVAREQTILEISHNPGPITGSPAREGVVAKVDGLHGASAGVVVISLAIAVIEAALVVVVSSVQDCVHSLGVIVGSRGIGLVVTVSRERRDEDSVCLLPIQCDWSAGCAGQIVIAIGFRAAVSTTGGSAGEVIARAGLVVDGRNQAGCVNTEVVLDGGIGNTASGEGRDINGGVVGTTRDLVERALVGGVQGSSGAVSSDTGRVACSVDVAGCLVVGKRARDGQAQGKPAQGRAGAREHLESTDLEV